MLNPKIRISLWGLYIIFYIWVALDIIENWDNSMYSYTRITTRTMAAIGVIGYVLGLKIAYKIIWKILFLIMLLSVVFIIIAAFFSHIYSILSGPIYLSPMLYALYSYVYRSNHIWRNTNKENKLT